jgi:hypothetical protein
MTALTSFALSSGKSRSAARQTRADHTPHKIRTRAEHTHARKDLGDGRPPSGRFTVDASATMLDRVRAKAAGPVWRVGKRGAVRAALAILKHCGVLGAAAHQGRAGRRRNGWFERSDARVWDGTFTQWYATRHLGSGSHALDGWITRRTERKRPRFMGAITGIDLLTAHTGHSGSTARRATPRSRQRPVPRERTRPRNPPKWRKSSGH